MENNRQQQILYKERLRIKQNVAPIQIENSQYRYISRFIRKNSQIFGLTIVLLFLQTVAELILILSTRGLLYGGSEVGLSGLILLLITICYILTTFYSVKYERTLSLGFINDLRAKLFSQFLDKNTSQADYAARSTLLTKVSYHLSLISMGVDNSLISIIRWIATFVLVIFLSILSNSSVYIFIPIILFINILFLFGSYFVSKYFISKQVTSYSAIVKHIAGVLFDFEAIKEFRHEDRNKDKLDRIVDVDTFFRIKRDIWIRYSNRVVFIVLILLVSLFLVYNKDLLVIIASKKSLFLKGLFFVYCIRTFYLSVKVGIYAIPLKIGVSLCVPTGQKPSLPKKTINKWRSISFRSNKVKLHTNSDYYKNVSLTLNSGSRYLFVGNSLVGKTLVARLFSGGTQFSRHSWLVKVDEERFSYNQWSEIFDSKYFFAPQFSSDMTVGEVVLNKKKEDIDSKDIALVEDLVVKYPIIAPAFNKNAFIGESLYDLVDNHTLLFMVQFAHCLIRKPSLVVIDNFWIDINYSEITSLIEVLSDRLPEATIVIFSRNYNSVLKYNEIFNITNNLFKKE